MCQIGSDLTLTIGMLFVREIPLLLIGEASNSLHAHAVAC